MTNFTLPNPGLNSGTTLSPKTALKWAWLSWTVLLVVPFLFLEWLIWHMGFAEVTRSHAQAPAWFGAAMAYLVIILPATFFWRGHLFKEYWKGHPVAPRKYLLATITVGVALALGGMFSLLGCLATGSFMPNLIPAVFSLLLFALHWPSGRAMIVPGGNTEDPQLYEEPG